MNADPRTRENLIKTAVEFLHDPQVSAAPLKKKVDFLMSKTLTEEEIQKALAMVKTANSLDGKSRRWHPFLVGFLIGGVSYSIYLLYLHFILPFFKRQKRVDQKLLLLEESIQNLRDNITLTIKAMQTSVEKLDVSLQLHETATASMESRMTHNHGKEMDELKAEVVSLKGILLNVRNFPTSATSLNSVLTQSSTEDKPQVETAVSTASFTVPAWQLTDSALHLSPSISAPCLPPCSYPIEVEVLEKKAGETESGGKAASESSTGSGDSATSFEVIESKESGLSASAKIIEETENNEE